MSKWAVTVAMTPEQLDAHALRLLIDDLGYPQPPPRSPSPPPMYDAQGRRTNTREQRAQEAADLERTRLVDEALKLIPGFHPPKSFKPVRKTTDKFWLPVNQFPDINFMGLLLGPRGNTLRRLETDSGAKLSIRGRGSVRGSQNSSEDLHCVVHGETESQVNEAMRLLRELVDRVTTDGDLKRNQLRELARLNGTLRDFDSMTCHKCGQQGHMARECPANEPSLDHIEKIFAGVSQNVGPRTAGDPRSQGSSTGPTRSTRSRSPTQNPRLPTELPKLSKGHNKMPTGPPGLTHNYPEISTGPPGLTGGAPSTPAGNSGIKKGPPGIPAGPPGISAGHTGTPKAFGDPDSPPGISVAPPGMSKIPPRMPTAPPGIPASSAGISAGPPGISVGPPGIVINPPGVSNGPPGLVKGPPRVDIGPDSVGRVNEGPPGLNSAVLIPSTGPSEPQTNQNLPRGVSSQEKHTPNVRGPPPGVPPPSTD